MNEPRVYKNSPAILVVIVVLFLVLIGGIVLGTGGEDMPFLFIMGGFGVFIFSLIFVANSAKVVITDEDITTQNLFGTKNLRWTEIARVSGSGYGIKLHNQDGDVTLSPNSQLPKYEEIIDFIGSKRPDLFSPQEYSEINRGWQFFLQIVLIFFIFGGILIGFVLGLLNSRDTSLLNFVPLAIFGVLFTIYLLTTLFAPGGLILDGNSLTVKYLFNGKALLANEISFIQLGYNQTRNGKQYFVALHLTNRKAIRLSGLGLSLPITYLVLKNWHQNNLHGQSANMPQNNIAPNWSDKSQN